MYSWSLLFHLKRTYRPSYKNHCAHIHEWLFHTKNNFLQLKSTNLLSLVSIIHCPHNHLLTIYAKCHREISSMDVVLHQDQDRSFLSKMIFPNWLSPPLLN